VNLPISRILELSGKCQKQKSWMLGFGWFVLVFASPSSGFNSAFVHFQGATNAEAKIFVGLPRPCLIISCTLADW
jgi:hypothetical protein